MYLHGGWGVHLQVKAMCMVCRNGGKRKANGSKCICRRNANGAGHVCRNVCKPSRCRRDLQHLLHAGQLVAGLAQRSAALHLFCIHRLPALEVNHLPAWVMANQAC